MPTTTFAGNPATGAVVNVVSNGLPSKMIRPFGTSGETVCPLSNDPMTRTVVAELPATMPPGCNAIMVGFCSVAAKALLRLLPLVSPIVTAMDDGLKVYPGALGVSV